MPIGTRKGVPSLRQLGWIVTSVFGIARERAQMLVLSRKMGERIWIGDEIAITVVRVNGAGVRIGIEAPPHLAVMRDELKQKILLAQTKSQNQQPPILEEQDLA